MDSVFGFHISIQLLSLSSSFIKSSLADSLRGLYSPIVTPATTSAAEISDSSSQSDSDSVIFVNTAVDGLLCESLQFLRVSSSFSTTATITQMPQVPISPTSAGGVSKDARVSALAVEVWNTHDNLIPFMSGYTDIHTGILHLYRDNQPTPATDLPLVICALAVPHYMTPADFLNFIGPAVVGQVAHFCILRDSSSAAGRFMVLMRFRASEAAHEFYLDFNRRAFNSLQPELCHVVYVKSVQVQSDVPAFADMLDCYGVPAVSAGDDGDGVDDNMVELPSCPVCLERMDSSVSGLLTTICQHSFHCRCLRQWTDSSCPVCRFTSGSSTTVDGGHSGGADGVENVCGLCSSTQNLWVCLICGHLGCGRYQQAHAYAHYLESGHLYTMELESQRVWDYGNDLYVHRLIQNKTDGKVVEFGAGTRNEGKSNEKLDDLALEFTNLLTVSLDAQRTHFESELFMASKDVTRYHDDLVLYERKLYEMSRVEADLHEENDNLRKKCSDQEEANSHLQSELKQTQSLCTKLTQRLKEVTARLDEEETVSKQLLENQPAYTAKISELETRLSKKDEEIAELQESVRDLMVFLDARQKLENMPNEDIVGGSIGISAPDTPASKSKKKGRRK